MNCEENIKTAYKEVNEDSDESSKNLKSELKKNCDVEKSQSQSKKLDAIDDDLYSIYQFPVEQGIYKTNFVFIVLFIVR